MGMRIQRKDEVQRLHHNCVLCLLIVSDNAVIGCTQFIARFAVCSSECEDGKNVNLV
jgi:hypothetical protein